jgi:hypothetical protein
MSIKINEELDVAGDQRRGDQRCGPPRAPMARDGLAQAAEPQRGILVVPLAMTVAPPGWGGATAGHSGREVGHHDAEVSTAPHSWLSGTCAGLPIQVADAARRAAGFGGEFWPSTCTPQAGACPGGRRPAPPGRRGWPQRASRCRSGPRHARPAGTNPPSPARMHRVVPDHPCPAVPTDDRTASESPDEDKEAAQHHHDRRRQPRARTHTKQRRRRRGQAKCRHTQSSR